MKVEEPHCSSLGSVQLTKSDELLKDCRIYVHNIMFQSIFVKGECQVKGLLSSMDLLKAPAQTVPLPSQPADPDDVCCVMFSSVDIASAIWHKDTEDLPKGIECTHIGFKTGLYACG